MGVEEKAIVIFRMANGNMPFVEWMISLDDKAQTIVESRLNRIRLGNMGDVKTIGGGVHEFRIDYGPGYRIYFGNAGGKAILLLVGGGKSGQQKDIRKAMEYWREFKERT